MCAAGSQSWRTSRRRTFIPRGRCPRRYKSRRAAGLAKTIPPQLWTTIKRASVCCPHIVKEEFHEPTYHIGSPAVSKPPNLSQKWDGSEDPGLVCRGWGHLVRTHDCQFWQSEAD